MRPLGIALGVGVLLCGAARWPEARAAEPPAQLEIGARVVEVLRVEGLLFKGLSLPESDELFWQ